MLSGWHLLFCGELGFQSAGTEEPCGSCQSSFHSSSVCVLLAPTISFYAILQSSPGATGARACDQCGPGCALDGPSIALRVPECSQIYHLVSASNALPLALFRCRGRLNWLSPITMHFIWHSLYSSTELPRNRRGQSGVSLWSGSHGAKDMVNQPESCQIQSAFSILLLGVRKHMHALHEWRLGFLQPLVTLVFKPAKQIHLPRVLLEG